MTFAEVLKQAAESDICVSECTEQVRSCQAALEKARDELAAASEANASIHREVCERLKDKGHRSMTTKDGTVTIYHLKEESPTGWASYQPIPGEAS